MTGILIHRAGPLTTIQDEGRFGSLGYGISASGPMDRAAYGAALPSGGGGNGAIEFTLSGIEIEVLGPCEVGFAGGDFAVTLNDRPLPWPGSAQLAPSDRMRITPGRWGNYGYLRFSGDILVPPVMGSISTSSRVGLGGLEGRPLRAGDTLAVGPKKDLLPLRPEASDQSLAPLRLIWGIHADHFPATTRQRFVSSRFAVSSRLDRMGVRLADEEGVFADTKVLSLVSDAMVPGDIQILGDGTPIVLMRDHQPTGGYPRIATVITADLDRFAQMRPGTPIEFAPVTVEHARRLLRSPS